MKRLRNRTLGLLLVALTLLVLGAAPAAAAVQTVELSVVGLVCAKDIFAVEATLDSMIGVTDYSLDMSTETAVVSFNDQVISLDKIKDQFEREDYPIRSAVVREE